MAIQFVDTDGTLVIPQANAQWMTAPSNAGIATRGVIVLVGEADMGPSYAQEPDNLTAAIFGPGQFSAVQQKYGSGNIVDAFRVASNPSRDPGVRGAPTQIICVKTNTGTQAQGVLSGGYGVLQAISAGALGNLVYVQVTSAAAEVPPVLTLNFIHYTGAETIAVSANGGTPVGLVVSGITPAAFVAANAAALLAQNVTLAGGTIYQPGNGLVGVTCSVTASSNIITIVLSGGLWASQPKVGEVLVVADSSTITGAGNANSGQYVVTSSTPAGLVATKFINTDGATLTPPVNVGAGASVVAGTMDAYTVITFTNTAVLVNGLGKFLAFYRSAGPASHFVSGITPVSTSLSAISTIEAAVNILVNRKSDGVSEAYRVGGNVTVTIGHVGAGSSPVVVGPTNITLNGGAPIPLASYKTLADLVAYINAQSGWVAAVPAAFASLPPTVLDEGTFESNQNSYVGTMPARIKKDAYDTLTAIGNSNLVEFVATPSTGLPVVQAVFFLSGGTRGGTTDAAVAAALAAAGLTRCNFVVTLFSADATVDYANGTTDASSTYTVDGINAYLAAHVIQFSQFKKRRPRQAFGSKQTTFALAKTAAQTLASYRLFMSFLDVNTIGANGTQWFQPWMGSVLAAGMQAAGFYRPIFNKSIACTGVRQFAGDFSTQDDDAVEQALLAGLGVIRERDGGGFSFVSDQTTYGADDNFVLNSVQAVYVADVIAQTVAQRMERAFVGQSFADVTASAALSFLKGIMADLKRLKLITSSDDAVDGYKDAMIEIRPPAMLVSAEIKEATGLYFIPIKFLITQVTQTANQG